MRREVMFRATLAVLTVVGISGTLSSAWAQRARPEGQPLNVEREMAMQPQPEGGVAIRAGRLFDSKAGRMLTNQVILDETEMLAITDGLSSLKVQRIVDENPADLKQYGLDAPRVEVTVKVSGDKETERLMIGEKTAMGGEVYAKRALDTNVFLIAAHLDATFNRSTFDLRDKAVLKVDRDKIDAIEIAAAGHIVQLARRGVEWDIEQPVRMEADFGTVTELVTKLTSQPMKSVVAPGATDLATYGLAQPVGVITIRAGSARATLQVGKSADESTTYTRDVSRPMVFTIDSSLADYVMKDPGEFRRKDILQFQTFEATRIELTRDGQTTIYEKVKGIGKDPADRWREVSPTARDIDTSKMETALSRLSYLRAVGFADPRKVKTGLDAPGLSVLVKYDEGKKEERVRLAKVDATPFAARAEWRDAAKLDANAYGLLINALDELKK